MSVSTIFLQTTNEGDNEYGDTTFSIHVPVKEKSYKLSVASFMFRPKIILMDETEYLTFKISISRDYANDYDDNEVTFKYDHHLTLKCGVKESIPFNPSKTDVTAMQQLLPDGYVIPILIQYQSTDQQWYEGRFVYKFENLTWKVTSDNYLTLTYDQGKFAESNLFYAEYDTDENHQPIQPLSRDTVSQCNFIITDFELTDISPKLSYFTGLTPTTCTVTQRYDIDIMENVDIYYLKGFRCYNPHYWNYITLSCNKSYNTGNVVNQERFNTDIDESSQFYKGQILAYMPNNAYAPEAMQTGMATANEYIIQPADFNSIRFWLNYDNGEPVKLCSPMTIVLNMMPNQ